MKKEARVTITIHLLPDVALNFDRVIGCLRLNGKSKQKIVDEIFSVYLESPEAKEATKRWR